MTMMRTNMMGRPGWLDRACALVLAILLAPAAGAAERQAEALPCETGSYALSDGSALDVGPGAGEGQLRWRLDDGTTGALEPAGEARWTSTAGWTDRPDGHDLHIPGCGRGAIRFGALEGRRVPLLQVDTRFEGSGVELAGRLTMPPGDARVPIVVLVHGAEHSSALHDYSLQRQFAAAGIGVFAYDKRGTGASGGRYTQNYLTLAVDAVHAAREARRLAGTRAGRIGYQGGSQGGWVAPLAARIEPADFVIVSFGLAVSPLDEDRAAIAGDLERAGHGDDAAANSGAMDIADAVAAVVDSAFTGGYDRLAAVKAKYVQAPWYPRLRGNIAGFLLANDEATIRAQGPVLLEGVPARYDAMAVLSNLDVPQLWILGGKDRDAPPAETLRRLAALRAAGRPIAVAVFPDAEHGMYEFEEKPGDERVSTRQPDGYFRLMRDFILGRPLAPAYGGVPIQPSP